MLPLSLPQEGVSQLPLAALTTETLQDEGRDPSLETLQEIIDLGGPDLGQYKDMWVQGSLRRLQQNAPRC